MMEYKLGDRKLLIFLCFYFVAGVAGQTVAKSHTVHYLDADNVINYEPNARHRGFFDSDLQTYCYRGNPKTLARFFETIELQLEIDGDDYTQYEGVTPEEVQQHRDEHRSLFSFNLFSQKKTRLQLSPFQQQCIGIESGEAYRLRLQQVRIDFWRVIQLLVALMLFLSAEQLSHNSVFYYITGVALGICSSFMLLIWLAGKLVPRKTMMYGVLIGGWTIGIYILQMLWENLQVIVLTYRTYVFWYILATGITSFLFCYRIGPPKNKRSKNIVKWLLQLMSLGLIYFSSRFEEASAACIILAIVYHYFPRVLFRKIRSLILRRFPPKRRLLTTEEFYEEGVRETTKALKELRAFASSPDCKQWKVMSKLSDPMRFAAFVEGASHLRDEEILRFECSKSDFDDDEDSELSQEDEPQQVKNVSRHQMQPTVRRSYATSSSITRTLPASEMSEEDEEEEEEEQEHYTTRAATSSQSLRHTPNLNSSRRLVANGSYHYLSPTVSVTQRASAQRTLSRSTMGFASAPRSTSSRNSSLRTFEVEREENSSSD